MSTSRPHCARKPSVFLTATAFSLFSGNAISMSALRQNAGPECNATVDLFLIEQLAQEFGFEVPDDAFPKSLSPDGRIAVDLTTAGSVPVLLVYEDGGLTPYPLQEAAFAYGIHFVTNDGSIFFETDLGLTRWSAEDGLQALFHSPEDAWSANFAFFSDGRWAILWRGGGKAYEFAVGDLSTTPPATTLLPARARLFWWYISDDGRRAIGVDTDAARIIRWTEAAGEEYSLPPITRFNCTRYHEIV